MNIKREIQVFFTALAFYTRIPCYKFCDYSAENIRDCVKFLPVIGWIVGAFSGLVFMLSLYIFPATIAILLSMISTILLTGAFHEDGFADFCDGFGGGFGKEQILRIMKDSTVGAYAVIGTICILALKYLTLFNINYKTLPIILIAAHSISRFNSITIIFTHEYVRKNDNTGKSHEKAEKYSLFSIIIMLLLALFPMFLLDLKYLLILIPIFIIRQLFASYIKRKIGGYSGDCLGALQQISEVVFYLFVVIFQWKFI